MNDKVILCHNKIFNLWTRIVCFGFLVFMTVLQFTTEPKMDDWIAFFFGIVAIITIWILLELEYHFHELRIENGACRYRTMFGKVFEYSLNDIHAIYSTTGKFSKTEQYVLLSKNGEKIAVLGKEMQIGNELIDFFENQKEVGNWTGSFIKEYEAAKYTRLSKIIHSEQLMIKPNWKEFIDVIFLGVCAAVGLCFVLAGFFALINGDSDKVLYLGGGILLVGYTCIPIILTTMKSINKYRNWRLFISQDHCFYVDEEGKKFLFQIEDIEDISIKVTAGRPSREYRIISFKDKRKEIWVDYDYTMSHVKELQGFLNKCREN